MSAREEIEAFARQLLAERLAQCTEPQRALFSRCYPKGLPAGSLETAIDLCTRTIAKNERKAAATEQEPYATTGAESP
jgi:hypothetical protein